MNQDQKWHHSKKCNIIIGISTGNWKHSNHELVDSVSIGCHVVRVLRDGVDVVLVGVVVVIVEVVVDVSHKVEGQEGECDEIERVEAVVALTTTTSTVPPLSQQTWNTFGTCPLIGILVIDSLEFLTSGNVIKNVLKTKFQ